MYQVKTILCVRHSTWHDVGGASDFAFKNVFLMKCWPWCISTTKKNKFQGIFNKKYAIFNLFWNLLPFVGLFIRGHILTTPPEFM